MKITIPALLIFFCSLVIVSCSQGTQEDKLTGADSLQNVEAASVAIVDSSTNEIYVNYIKLKDALVASNAEDAKSASASLAMALEQVEGCENTAQIASNISESTDLELQRSEFTMLSADVVALMKHTNISSGNIYVQYCPMANDNEGGYWLASDSLIRNPYFGSKMLKCGEVKETLAAR